MEIVSNVSLLQNTSKSGMIIINVSKERAKRAYSFGECLFFGKIKMLPDYYGILMRIGRKYSVL